MNSIQSTSPYYSMTYAQKKEMYDRMYDAEGNMKPSINGSGRRDDLSVPGSQGLMNGYAVGKMGDDYAIFSMNPLASFSGGKELTQDQLEYLRGKYDMDNLSQEDRTKLLAELSMMGVISGSDAYAEAYPEKCPWVQNQQQQFGIGSNELDMSKWVEYYLQRATQAQDDMDKLNDIASRTNSLAYVESQRRTNNFYTSLARVMNQISQK